MSNKTSSFEKITCIYLLEKAEAVLLNLRSHPTVEGNKENLESLNHLLNTLVVLKSRIEKS